MKDLTSLLHERFNLNVLYAMRVVPCRALARLIKRIEDVAKPPPRKRQLGEPLRLSGIFGRIVDHKPIITISAPSPAFYIYQSLQAQMSAYCAGQALKEAEPKPTAALSLARSALRAARHKAGDDEIAAVKLRTNELYQHYPLEALGLFT